MPTASGGISANFFGKLYDWGSVTLTVLGALQIGVDAIDIRHKKDSINVYGFGLDVIGYYNKNNEYSSSIGFLYDQFQTITAAALAQGLTPMEIPPFSIIMILGSTQDPLVPYKAIVMQNCRFTSDDFVIKQNSGGIYQVYPIAYAGKIATF